MKQQDKKEAEKENVCVTIGQVRIISRKGWSL